MFKNIFSLLLLVVTSSYGQVDKWEKYMKTKNSTEFQKLLQPDIYNLSQNKALARITSWEKDSAITGKMVYDAITHWSTYPTPTQTGVLLKYHVKLKDTKIATNYSPPFYVYLPKGYTPNKPSKLLVYYKGGWISRKEFPEYIDKEIIDDNPTFKYLDQYNIIQIFPALKSNLAIFGWYGYEHLEKLLLATKQLFNIDDNQVYLAGFSDGGRTVYNIAFLAPSPFAGFYSINGTFNNFYMNFPNFSNRSITSFAAKKDQLVDYKTTLAIAEKANTYGTNWNVHVFDEGHFYFPYEKKILPTLFQSVNNTSRSPFPNRIVYHKDYDYSYFKGIDWLHFKTNMQKKPEPWHHTSTLTLPAKDSKSETLQYGQKTAQVNASYFNNTYTIKASLVEEVTIYISPTMVNLKQPVRIIINGKEVFYQQVGYDKAFLIEQFRNKFDRKQVWIQKITVKVP